MKSVGLIILFLSFVSLASAQVPKKCWPPPQYPNTTLVAKFASRQMFNTGEKVYYNCAEDFTPTRGSRAVQCVDGKWTKLALKCEKRSCGNVGDLLYGEFHYEGLFVGDKAYAVCNDGYTLKGLSYLVCKKSGWTGEFPSCEVKSCGSAGEILNGQFMYTGVEFGDTATAVCDEGFTLVGEATRNCTSDGWDGHIPACEALPAVECPEPAEVANAERKGVQEPPYTYRSVIRYQCRVGTLIGQKDIWCTKDGTWSSHPPECKEITCQPPDVPNAVLMGGHTKPYQYRDTISIK